MSVLASLRARHSLGELVLEVEEARARVRGLESVAVAMTACVSALVLDLDELGAEELRDDLAELLGQLRRGDDTEELVASGARRQREALEYAGRERDYLAARDAELRRIIALLTEGLASVTQGAAAYHRTLLENGARLESASRLGDLARMRAAITAEVQGLRRAVADRQAEEKVAIEALRGEVDQLRRNVETARSEARTDPLTGAANRAAFDEELARRCELAATGGQGFALLLGDIDHFKAINDRHGHPIGDRVLRTLVSFLRARVRRADMIARWGGEEFAIVMASASQRTAHRKAREMVAELASRAWTIEPERLMQFTMSMGATAWRQGDTPAKLVERVDGALYEAKEKGRNRACRG